MGATYSGYRQVLKPLLMMTQNNVISVSLEIFNFGTLFRFVEQQFLRHLPVHTNVQQANRHGSQQKGRLEAQKAFPSLRHRISTAYLITRYQWSRHDSTRGETT